MLLEVENFSGTMHASDRYADKTCKAYASDSRGFVSYLEGKLGRQPEIRDFSAVHISDYLQAELTAGRQLSTLRRRAASLRRFAYFLIETGKIGDNPARTIDFSSLHAGEKRKQKSNSLALRPEEVARIERSIAGRENARALRDSAIFSILLETGLSVAALVAIDLSDIKLPEGRMSLIDPDGKLFWMQFHRSVHSLNKYLRDGRPDLTQSKTETALFVSQTGGRMSRQAVWQVLRKWGQVAGISSDVTPRVVRNTSALHMAQSGNTIRNIQRALGHRNPFSTRALLRRLRAEARL